MTVPDRRGAASSERVELAVVAGLFLVSIAMRPQVLAIGPLLPLIREDLDLSAGIAGLLTTIPVMCMGIFAPFGPRLAARLGPRSALAVCLALIAGFGLIRTVAPTVPLVLLATFAIGVGIGVGGAIPAMFVAGRIAHRPALGTGVYATGIVAGSTIAAAIAVPLAVGGEWRIPLAVLSVGSLLSLVAWLILIRDDVRDGARRTWAPRLPWRSGTGWLLAVLFGLQSILYYGVVAWMPNVFVERGWSTAEAGSLVAIVNGLGLVSTVGVPLFADRFGSRRRQLLAASSVTIVGMLGIILASDLAYLWLAMVGLALAAIFPLVLTLPIDVSDDPAQVGSVAALMLLGGYVIASIGPFVLGAVRDLTGDFAASLWLLVVVSLTFTGFTSLLSRRRLHRGIPSAVPPV